MSNIHACHCLRAQQLSRAGLCRCTNSLILQVQGAAAISLHPTFLPISSNLDHRPGCAPGALCRGDGSQHSSWRGDLHLGDVNTGLGIQIQRATTGESELRLS